MIGATPVDEPETIPEVSPTDAELPEAVHEPPGDASLRVVVPLTHTFSEPVIASGSGLTVIISVVEHPAPRE